jgi:hypothetical protein
MSHPAPVQHPEGVEGMPTFTVACKIPQAAIDRFLQSLAKSLGRVGRPEALPKQKDGTSTICFAITPETKEQLAEISRLDSTGSPLSGSKMAFKAQFVNS